MNLKTTIVSAVAAATLFGVSPVMADSCTTQYGGSCPPVPQDLVVDKQVKNAVTREWKENLSESDVVYAPGNEVEFRFSITNRSGETFAKVYVKDTLPPYTEYVSGGPSGSSYNKDTRELTFTIDNLVAGQTWTSDVIRARVVDASKFPVDKDFCVVNTAYASSTGRSDDDTAQFCLNANIAGVTTLPKAGFNDIAFVLPYIGMGLGGAMLLRVKSKKGITE